MTTTQQQAESALCSVQMESTLNPDKKSEFDKLQETLKCLRISGDQSPEAHLARNDIERRWNQLWNELGPQGRQA